MRTNKQIIIYSIFNYILLLLLTFTVKLNLILLFSSIVIYSTLIFCCIKFKKNLIIKITKYLLIVLISINIIGYILCRTDVLSNLSSVHEIKNFILSTKEWGIFIFCVIQFLQIIILPIPSFIIILAGVNIWGILKTIIICGSTVILASCIAFIFGKYLGGKAINKLIGNKNFEMYRKLLSKHSSLYLSLMFIFPFFPDDLLCVLAGTTNMNFIKFFIISFFTRPVSIIITAVLGDYFIQFLENSSLFFIIAILISIFISISIILKHKSKIVSFLKKKINFKFIKNKK